MKEDATPIEEEVNENPEQPWVSDDSAAEVRNYKWREVIDELMNGAKITDAYAKAYDIDVNVPSKYNAAAANGSRLIRNDKFKVLWRKVLEERGFTDEMADWQLTDMMTNPVYEPKDRFKAIKHYNELRGRITTNVDVKSAGERINPLGELTAEELRRLADRDE